MRYGLVHETPPLASAPLRGVRFDRPVRFATAYALTRRDVMAADLPTRSRAS